MLSLPFSDPDDALRQVETFGDRKHVTGFMVTTVRTLPVHDNAYMKVYRAIEERGLALCLPLRAELGRAGVQDAATASSRCMRSASRSTTSCISPTG